MSVHENYHLSLFGVTESKDKAAISVLPVPWDLTCSYGAGSASNLEAIVAASAQLDFWDPECPNALDQGVHVMAPDTFIHSFNISHREHANAIYHYFDQQVDCPTDLKQILAKINDSSQDVTARVQSSVRHCVDRSQFPIVLGGEHSVSLGAINAMAETYPSFGILQWDAHMDCRAGYAGFEYSHASVMYHASKCSAVTDIIQVGIRDCCQEEVAYTSTCTDTQFSVFYDADISAGLFEGRTWASYCEQIVAACPDHVYISCDIDGFNPSLCPSTGTPVPGGLGYNEWVYLIRSLKKANKTIIGADLVEVVAGTVWDANVAARLLYEYCILNKL